MVGGKTKKPTAPKGQKEQKEQEGRPKFTKDELLRSKTLGFPGDVVKAVLKDDGSYTREEAKGLLSDFLCRKV